MNAADRAAMTQAVASLFLLRLSESMTDEQWREFCRRTREEKVPGICHSHDYCDANQVMIDAYEEATGTEWGCSTEDDDPPEVVAQCELCHQVTDDAWNLMKLKAEEMN